MPQAQPFPIFPSLFSDIVFRGVDQSGAEGVFRGLMHVVHPQFPENVLSVGIHRMETGEAFFRYLALSFRISVSVRVRMAFSSAGCAVSSISATR